MILKSYATTNLKNMLSQRNEIQKNEYIVYDSIYMKFMNR